MRIKKKRASNKKGISKILEVILLILLVLAIIFFLYATIKRMIKEQNEVSEVKVQLFTESMNIDRVQGDIFLPSQINLTIKRGASKVVITNYTTISTPQKNDMISVADLTGSMIGTKIDVLKNATRDLVNYVLKNQNNRIGLVGYNESVKDSQCHNLSNDNDSLFLVVDSWNAYGSTCICCGINKAVDMLREQSSLENNQKSIILMSDGQASDICYPPVCNKSCEQNTTVESSTFEAANYSRRNGIKIYAVGFGADADKTILSEIANITGGEYYSSQDISKLSEVYMKIVDSIYANYEAEISYYLKVAFYNDTSSYIYEIYNPPQPLETRTYTIPIYDMLSDHISNIKRIEIYPVMKTSSGRLVIGQAFDIWTAKII